MSTVTAQDFLDAILVDRSSVYRPVAKKETMQEFDALLSRARQEASDAAYTERNQVVAALARCFPSVVTKTAIEGWDPAWHNCVYITLPTGQASWHFHDKDANLLRDIPRGDMKWDGHTTPEKYDRLDALKFNQARREALKEMDDALSTFYATLNLPKCNLCDVSALLVEKLRAEYNQP